MIFKNLFIFLSLIFILIIFVGLSNNSSLFYNNILTTLNIWLYKVFPPIFTFYVISSIVINFDILSKLSFIFLPLRKIFRFEKEKAFSLFIISIFLSTPATLSLAYTSYQKNEITKNDFYTLIKCGSFIGPLFIINFLNGYSTKYIILIILIHLLTNFLFCILLTKKNKTNKESFSKNNFSLSKQIIDFFDSLSSIVSILLMIASTMIFCSIVKTSIIYIKDLFDKDIRILKYFTIIVEISTGLDELLSFGLSSSLTLMLFSMLISFNGLAIHLQVFTVLKKRELYKKYFIYRVLQAVLSLVLVFLLFN